MSTNFNRLLGSIAGMLLAGAVLLTAGFVRSADADAHEPTRAPLAWTPAGTDRVLAHIPGSDDPVLAEELRAQAGALLCATATAGAADDDRSACVGPFSSDADLEPLDGSLVAKASATSLEDGSVSFAIVTSADVDTMALVGCEASTTYDRVPLGQSAALLYGRSTGSACAEWLTVVLFGADRSQEFSLHVDEIRTIA